jgi:LysM repeat protein
MTESTESTFESALPWIILIGGVALTTGLIVYGQKKPAQLPALKSTLTPELKSKVDSTIVVSTDPAQLRQLANGLAVKGSTLEALTALAKGRAIEGNPIATPIPGAATTYKVATGDIPGAIAKRFGIPLSVLAKANGVEARRIMAGVIKVNEVLKLPPGAVDGGIANRAKGLAA